MNVPNSDSPKAQIGKSVEWEDAIEELVEGYRDHLEGEWPGHVLREYHNEIDSSVTTMTITDLDDRTQEVFSLAVPRAEPVTRPLMAEVKK